MSRKWKLLDCGVYVERQTSSSNVVLVDDGWFDRKTFVVQYRPTGDESRIYLSQEACERLARFLRECGFSGETERGQ